MPVTVNVVNHAANVWKGGPVDGPENLLKAACPKQWRRCETIHESSFEETLRDHTHVSPSDNGFVWAAYHAYSDHHHLLIRPEDVWFCILTQLSFYINAHAEELRSFFVPHKGKKELEAISQIRDFGKLALQMGDLLAKNVNDPQLRDWVMPDFSTTTYHDRIVGVVLFMGAMQAYFDYKCSITCGLPSVTLLGDLVDWQTILNRLDMIDQLGEEPKQFARMLRPILQHMILTFEDPSNDDVTSFWNRILHRHHVGSGTDYLSGWLTAFCFWNDKGEAKSLRKGWQGDNPNELFDGVEYPYVDIDSIPLGYATVPVRVDDNGYEYDATMVAGSVGISASSSNRSMALSDLAGEQVRLAGQPGAPASDTAFLDTIQPVSGWWIYENEAKTKSEAREAEKKKLEEALEKNHAETTAMSNEERMTYYRSDRWKEHMAHLNRLSELEAF